MRNGQQSFPVKSAKSEGTTESMNIQMPGTKTTEKTSEQTVSSRRCNRSQLQVIVINIITKRITSLKKGV